MSTLNRNTVKQLREELEVALAMLADNQGAEFTYRLGTMRYDPKAGNVKVPLEITAKGGLTEDAAKYKQWANDQRRYTRRVVPLLNEEFILQGKTMKPVGLRRTKVVVEEIKTGKRYLVNKYRLATQFATPEQEKA